MYTLLCNLDPGWEFENLLRGYSMDLYAHPDCGCWQAAKRRIEPTPPWGDWPRRIDPRHLNAELTETLYLHRGMPRLLLFNLPALSGDALHQAITRLGEVLPTDPNPPQCNVLILPAPAPNTEADFAAAHPELLTIATATWVDHLVLLPATDPRFDSAPYRLYGLRLLMALFAREEELQLTQFRRTRVVTLRMVNQPDAEQLSDTASQRWQMVAQALLQASDALRHASPGHGLRTWEQDAAVGFEAIDTLRARIDDPPPGGSLTLHLPCPWFYRATLPAQLNAEISRFYGALENELEQRFETLNSQYQHLQQEQWQEEAVFLQKLRTHTTLELGLHDDARALLYRQKHSRIAALRQTLLNEEQAILAHLRGDLRLETRRSSSEQDIDAPTITGELTLASRQGAHLYGDANRHYQRPLFQEDEALKNVLHEAQRAAARLASKAWFIGGLLLMPSAALLPILALRLPQWPGWAEYSRDPHTWGLDVGWLALFGVSYLITSGLQIFRQRRSLRLALTKLRALSLTLYQRSHQALSDTFRYQRLTLAMRRLLVLEEQIDRLLQERETALRDLAALENALTNQIEHYQTQGLTAIPSAFPPEEADLLNNRLREQPPGRWLPTALQHWPPRAVQTVEVTDLAFKLRAPLATDVLYGCAETILTRVLPDK
jgi:hypothetical protein